MFEKIHTFITQSSLTSGIYNSVYTFVKTQFENFQETLSVKTYTGIVEIVDKIATISLILLTIYILYSIFHFLYTFIFKGKFKIKILIALAIAIPFTILVYVIYAYLNIK